MYVVGGFVGSGATGRGTESRDCVYGFENRRASELKPRGGGVDGGSASCLQHPR